MDKKMKALILGVVIFIASIITIVTVNGSSKKPTGTYCIKSIEIQDGDTVWDIADETIKEYNMSEFYTVKKMVKEIEEMNNIDADYVHSGNYIVVPYYE